MAPRSPQGSGREEDSATGIRNSIRDRLQTVSLVSLLFILFVSTVPTASAHSAAATPSIPYWSGLVLVGSGLLVLGGSVLLKQAGRISPTIALYGVSFGLVFTAIGGIGFNALAPEAEYTARSMPFPRVWYQPIALFLSFVVLIGSLMIGRRRWPRRPRYTILGIVLGLWIAYPAFVTSGEYITLIGYVLVLSVPLIVGYILWQDCLGVIRSVLRDRTARYFGGGVALLAALFFMFAAGYLSFFPEQGINRPETTTISFIPVQFPLVTWPSVEWWFPQIPFAGMLSVGVLVIVGLIAGLVGLNAAMTARLWTAEEETKMAESTAGTAAFVGANACSCCGPIVAQFVVLVAGSSTAAPLYWLFIDPVSPAGTLFLTASIALLTASLLYAVGSLADSPACSVEERPSSVGIRAD
jgi:hypothetical protein